MVKGIVNKNKPLDALKSAKTNTSKSAFGKSTGKTSKTPLAGIAISKVLKMDKLKAKK